MANSSFIQSAKSGARLNVVRLGNGGLPVLFQHGLGGDAQQVARIFPQGGRFDLTTVECAGHGASSCPQPPAFSLESFYEDIEAFSAEHFQHGFVAGGISMGAALALAFAIRNPTKMHGLILVRPAWFLSKSPANLEPIREIGELLQRNTPKEALDAFVASSLAARIRQSSPDNYGTLIDYLGDHQPEWLGKLLTDITGDGFEFSVAQLEIIKVPTLVVGVEADDIHPLALAERLHRCIPGSRFEKAPRKDDALAIPNYYDWTAELIAGFLSEIAIQAPDPTEDAARTIGD
ncbi:alpha/beta fold hydrolase [Phyllobacterium zundukense]|uniref:Alpha/beta hydrolase n=1 Tax=Phyllobacterium zundukense TaxID=1867719 RepID=A0ACD4CV63_9HYPH|nr:alpha/beta hydrolase [Phyllobacterium zundukense]UXN57486.1 alpha/beta hydrolase [Phyllobacterium zundukense]